MKVMQSMTTLTTMWSKTARAGTAAAIAAGLAVATFSVNPVQAELPRSLTEFHATLLQLNEPGGVPFTGAHGSGTLRFDSTSNTLSYAINITGIPSTTMAHIHRGGIGINGPVVIDLQQGRAFTPAVTLAGTVVLTSAQVADLYAGNYYVNVHTPAHGGGELRGQVLVNQASRTFGALLSGSTETPVNNSPNSGTATVALSDDLSQIAYFLQVTGDLTPTMSHIHTGTIGTPGPVAIPLSLAFSAGELISGTSPMNAQQVRTLLSAGYYVNVHTTAFPGGELRGQLYPDQQEFAAMLSGENEVPPVVTEARGFAALHLHHATGEVEFRLSETGIQTPTMAHIHEGAAGTNGPVRIDLLSIGGGTFNPETPIQGRFTLTPTQITTMQGEGFYANVHSAAHPGGEIRGQVVSPRRYLVFQTQLSGTNEAPTPTNSSATGYASMVLDTATNALTYRFATQGMTPTMAHIHTGTVGLAGPIAFPLDLGGTGVVTLTDAQAFVLANNGYYVNVHSALFPAGEIRGQLNPQSPPRTFIAVLSGLNEVPTNTSPAFGGTILTLDPAQTRLHYFIDAGQITGVTMGHLHRGVPGVNGPVVIPFTNAASLTNDTPISGTVDLAASDLNDLITGNFYANIHTTQHPGGEIRGQVIAAPNSLWLPVVLR